MAELHDDVARVHDKLPVGQDMDSLAFGDDAIVDGAGTVHVPVPVAFHFLRQASDVHRGEMVVGRRLVDHVGLFRIRLDQPEMRAVGRRRMAHRPVTPVTVIGEVDRAIVERPDFVEEQR